jgi:hypothetical protein
MDCGDPAPLSSEAWPHRTFAAEMRHASPQKGKAAPGRRNPNFNDVLHLWDIIKIFSISASIFFPSTFYIALKNS